MSLFFWALKLCHQGFLNMGRVEPGDLCRVLMKPKAKSTVALRTSVSDVPTYIGMQGVHRHTHMHTHMHTDRDTHRHTYTHIDNSNTLISSLRQELTNHTELAMVFFNKALSLVWFL